MNGASAAAQAVVQAAKASGVFVQVEREAFLSVLHRSEAPLVVHAEGGVFSTHHKYLAGYKGLVFYLKVPDPLTLPIGTEVVEAKKIWVPSPA